jgi:hypothetical protein
MSLCQDTYIRKILKRFGMQDCYSKDILIEAGTKVFLVLYIDIASKSEINVY